MFLDINKIEPEGESFDLHLELGRLTGHGDEEIAVPEAHLSGRARKGPRGIELAARLQATIGLTCGRCLAVFEHRFTEDFFLVLVAEAVEFMPGDGDQASEGDIALFYAKDGKVALQDIAVEQIYLRLPLKAVCRPDCRGLCSRCGVDLNAQECDCEREPLDARLAPLIRFKSP